MKTLNDSNSKQAFKFTLGELLPDGGIEVLEGNQLVRWSDAEEQIASTLQIEGCNYVVAPLEPSLMQAMRFPTSTADFVSVEALLIDLGKTLADLVPMDEDALFLLAVFILSSWQADLLMTLPLLNVWGPPGAQNTLVDVLDCLCRRPLVISDLSTHDLTTLPEGLSPTIILTHPNRRSQERMLAASSTRQTTLLRRGRLVSMRNAMVACTLAPLPAPALTIPLLPAGAPYHRIDKLEAHKLAEKFGPRLLRYRLAQHAQVSRSCFDCSSFSTETRVLARALGAVLEGSPLLQARVAKILAPVDELYKAVHSEQPAATVLESVLVLCHEGRPTVFIEEITTLANGILVGRHETLQMNAKKIGSILRNEFGLHAKRKGPGYELTLDRAMKVRVHRLASSLGVLTTEKVEGCDLCTTTTSSWPSRIGELEAYQVHEPPQVADVHNVHNVHDSAKTEAL